MTSEDKTTNYQTINSILAIDQKNRYVGIKDDLHTLDTLRTDNSWHFDAPTLTSKKENYTSKKYVRDIAGFTETFFTKFRILKNLNLDNFLIAGGAVKSILIDETAKDIDIFVHGLASPEEATKRIERLVLDMQNNIVRINAEIDARIEEEKREAEMSEKKIEIRSKKSYIHKSSKSAAARAYKKPEPKKKINMSHINDDEFNAIYNGNTVNLFVDGSKLQIVLRLYGTPSEILHGFDLGSSAVGFDGKQVYFTTLSKFCYENMVNIFDGTRRSTTYELRLIKYFKNGFDIILPEMDMTKLSSKYFQYGMNEVCELPYMTFSYSAIDGNMIFVDKFFNKYSGEVDTDYEFYSDDGDDNSFKLLHYNLRQIIDNTGKYIYEIDLADDLKIYYGKGNTYKGWVLDFGGNVMKYGFIEHVYAGHYKKLKYDTVDLDTITKYFNVIEQNEFVNSVYLADIDSKEKQTRLDDIFQRQKKWIKDRLKDLTTDNKIKWMVDNPTTQLTSSFNPIIENAAQWYGRYFKTSNV